MPNSIAKPEKEKEWTTPIGNLDAEHPAAGLPIGILHYQATLSPR
jgi:hypothetical protein